MTDRVDQTIANSLWLCHTLWCHTDEEIPPPSDYSHWKIKYPGGDHADNEFSIYMCQYYGSFSFNLQPTILLLNCRNHFEISCFGLSVLSVMFRLNAVSVKIFVLVKTYFLEIFVGSLKLEYFLVCFQFSLYINLVLFSCFVRLFLILVQTCTTPCQVISCYLPLIVTLKILLSVQCDTFRNQYRSPWHAKKWKYQVWIAQKAIKFFLDLHSRQGSKLQTCTLCSTVMRSYSIPCLRAGNVLLSYHLLWMSEVANFFLSLLSQLSMRRTGKNYYKLSKVLIQNRFANFLTQDTPGKTDIYRNVNFF